MPIGILAYFGDEITQQKATTSRRIVTKPLSEQIEMLYTQNRITTVVKKAKKRTLAEILAKTVQGDLKTEARVSTLRPNELNVCLDMDVRKVRGGSRKLPPLRERSPIAKLVRDPSYVSALAQSTIASAVYS